MLAMNLLRSCTNTARSAACRVLDQLDDLMQATLLVGLALTLVLALAGCSPPMHSAAMPTATEIADAQRLIDHAWLVHGSVPQAAAEAVQAPVVESPPLDVPPPSF